ncbi:MAG: EpsG family protein [Epulopiscium sp.]|nr:EpsG family protein [Candidatus Epulonipiscium sp.]
MWLYYFLAIYILSCAIFIFSISNMKKGRYVYIVLTMGLFAILTMFRSEQVGNDTQAYIRLFNSISSGVEMSFYAKRYEIGFLYLNKVLSLISNNYQIIFVVSGAYIYFAYGRLIYKHSNMVWLSVFLFFTMRNFDLSMSGIRQMLALATVSISYEYIVDKKPFKFLCTVLLATSFHTVSIIFFLAYPLSKFKLTKRFLFTVMVTSAGIYILFIPILKVALSIFPRYSYYLNGTYLDGEARIATIISLTITALMLIISEILNHRFVYKNNSLRRYTIISHKTGEDDVQAVFLLIAYAFLLISLRGTILSRFTNIYSIFAIIYYPNAIAKMKNNKGKLLIIFITVVIFFCYSTMINLLRPEWQSTYPYLFYWNK